MVLPVYLHAAPNRHENPDLPGRTRLRRLWFIHTYENGFDQGIKNNVISGARAGPGTVLRRDRSRCLECIHVIVDLCFELSFAAISVYDTIFYRSNYSNYFKQGEHSNTIITRTAEHLQVLKMQDTSPKEGADIHRGHLYVMNTSKTQNKKLLEKRCS
jgi:hypothetical protein